MSDTVQATRSELEQVLDHLNAIRKTLTGILEREEPRDVRDVPGELGTSWDRHDDPTAD